MSVIMRRPSCHLRALALVLALPLFVAACGGSDTFTSPDGVPIAFEKAGAGDIALILVHGWSCDRTYWRHQMAGLADRFTIVTIDLAGHGESGRQRQDYTIPAFGRDVAAVVNGLDLENVYLVGHSMGGAVVVEAAALLGDRVRGIIGIDTLQVPEFRFTPQQVEGFLGPMRADFPASVDPFVRTMFPAGADTALVNGIVRDMAAAPPEVALSALSNYLLQDLMSTLRKLDKPIWCLNGNMEPINFEAWKFYRGGFTAVVMEGLGHFLFLEDPEGFNQELVKLVERMEAHES